MKYRAVVSPSGAIDLVPIIDEFIKFLDRHPECNYRGMSELSDSDRKIGRLVKHQDNIHI